MKLPSLKERRLNIKREQCMKKRAAILEKLAGRDIRSIASYETDSFYALYSELSRLASELADEVAPSERAEYVKLSRLCESRTELIKNKKFKS